MATATQLMPSPTTGLKSAFSPYTDSPSSPAPFAHVLSNRSSANTSDHLQPPASPYPATVDPSPVDSNGTNGTEIEDDAQVNQASDELRSSDMDDVVSPSSFASQESHTQPSKLHTALPARFRADSDDAPQSVIHAPANFKTFNRVSVSAAGSHETTSDQTAVVSPQTPEANMIPDEKHNSTYTHPIDTTVPTSAAPDRTTPRAQTREDHEDDGRRLSRASVSLTDIAETDDNGTDTASNAASEQAASLPSRRQSRSHSQSQTEVSDTASMETQTLERQTMRKHSMETQTMGMQTMGTQAMGTQAMGTQTMKTQTMETQPTGTQTMGEALHGINETQKEIAALRTALNECWTLCNTLAKLSQTHRQKMFHYSGGRADIQEHAWKTCWRLCQRLYDCRDDDQETQILPILELCRDFCQALFDVRHRGDETADSVLRVSFELNNHLYNAHDRSLPEAFRERTLDFYVTLCHRLMKQNTSLPEETDALLHACWSLAEMLFSIRQNSRDGKSADEELLGSAIQACWELCDMFRDGWTQVRPERGTPRPAQYSFAPPASVTHSQVSFSDRSGISSSFTESYHSAISMRPPLTHPETPTTIFDDREELSPAEDRNVPNILVLGPEAGLTRTHDRWSSAASSLSTYSDTSIHTSSTATAGREDPNLIRLKGLIAKAAINIGYTRQTPLPDFVRALPSNSFGPLAWQSSLLDQYRKLVLTDPTLRTIHNQPLRRLTASEIGRAVQWMARSETFLWMRDLYRFVFGSFPEDIGQRNMIINA